MPPLGLPKLSSEPVGFWPFFLGTLRDAMGNGNGSVTGPPHWTQSGSVDGILSTVANGRVDVADAVSLRLTTQSWYLYSSRGFRQSGTQTLVDKAVGNYRFQLLTDRMRLTAGGVDSDLVTAGFVGAKSIAVTLASGAVPTFYADHASLGVGDAALTPATGTDSLYLLGDGTSPVLTPCEVAAVFGGVLTVADLTLLDTYCASRITPRKQWPGGGLRYPDRETQIATDGDMEAPTAIVWPAYNSGVVTKSIVDPHNGSRNLRIDYGGVINGGSLRNILTPGQQYEVSGWFRSGTGVKAARVALGHDVASTTNTDWTYFHAVSIATSASFYLYSRMNAAGQYVEFDNIKLWTRPAGYTPATGDPLFLDNIQTARVTLANQTSGQLSNTPYQIESGTWKLAEDTTTGERYIECVVAGIISRRNLEAYGTWEFEMVQGSGSNTTIAAIAATDLVPYNTAPQTGWSVAINATKKILVIRSINGANTNKAYSASDYLVTGTRYRFAITRTAGNTMHIYVRGGIYTTWTLFSTVGGVGTNPFTDASGTTSLYSNFDFDAGDRLYLDNQFVGVLAPV